MPFPLAHPAAILPFRRLCPRRLNFPALVIGSLSPDLGYCFRALRLGAFSHRFLAGGFGFCLPVGFLLVQLFYLVRQPVVQRLPARHRQIFEPLCRRPIASPLVIALSLLIGAWTHSLLDSVSHANGWFAEHLPVLQKSLTAGNFHIHLYDLIYSACTFVGVAYVALAYQNWIERTAGAPGWTFPAFKRVSTPTLALLALLLSLAHQRTHRPLGMVSLGLATTILVVGFLMGTGWALGSFRQPGKPALRPEAAGNGATPPTVPVIRQIQQRQNPTPAEGCPPRP